MKEIEFDLLTTEVNDMLQAFEWNGEYLLFRAGLFESRLTLTEG